MDLILSIEAQGYGVIQMCAPREINPHQTLAEFHDGFLVEYQRYLEKERVKHQNFSAGFIPSSALLGY